MSEQSQPPTINYLTDHELLLKVLWTSEQIQLDMKRDRDHVHEIEKRLDREMAVNTNAIDKLRLWKAQVVGYTVACTAFMQLVQFAVTLYWKK